MADENQLQEEPDRTKLPVEVRAEMLSTETSLFFNVARFEHAQRIADMFAKSTMVPDHFKGNLGNCMIGLNYASRVGADPFMMMQCMYVVHGKPGIEGKLVAALINQSGKYKKPFIYEWLNEKDEIVKCHQVVNSSTRDNRGCRTRAIDKNSGESVYGPKITWEIVYAEGWFGKANSKWKTMPELMFMYRAASWFANIHCPEVKLGMPTTEELRDIVDLQKTSNGSYTADLTDKIKNGTPGAAKDLYAGKAGNVVDQDEKNHEGLKNGMKKQADAMIHGIDPALAKTFNELTNGSDAGTFWRMRETGLKEFFDTFRNVMGSWPQEVKDFIGAKCKNTEKKHPEFMVAFEDIMKAPAEDKEPNGYILCPTGGRRAGHRISPMVVCSGCDKRDGCDPYLTYLDSQRGGEDVAF